MRRMTIVALLVLAALALCAVLVHRHQRLEPSPEASPAEPPEAKTPMDAFQGQLKLDRPDEYETDDAVRRRLMERLHREEIRQQPQEERN